MFWGITLESGKRYGQKVQIPFQVTMAALEPCVNENATQNPAKNKPSKYVSVMVEHDKQEFLICTLVRDTCLQAQVSLQFDTEEYVEFFIAGEGTVHLTGCQLNEEDYEDEDEDMYSDLEDEDESEDEASELVNPKDAKKLKALMQQDAKRKNLGLEEKSPNKKVKADVNDGEKSAQKDQARQKLANLIEDKKKKDEKNKALFRELGQKMNKKRQGVMESEDEEEEDSDDDIDDEDLDDEDLGSDFFDEEAEEVSDEDDEEDEEDEDESDDEEAQKAQEKLMKKLAQNRQNELKKQQQQKQPNQQQAKAQNQQQGQKGQNQQQQGQKGQNQQQGKKGNANNQPGQKPQQQPQTPKNQQQPGQDGDSTGKKKKKKNKNKNKNPNAQNQNPNQSPAGNQQQKQQGQQNQAQTPGKNQNQAPGKQNQTPGKNQNQNQQQKTPAKQGGGGDAKQTPGGQQGGKQKQQTPGGQKLMKTFPGGVKVEEVREGTGPVANKGRVMHVTYVGRLPNGKEFDRSENKPFTFRLGRGEVIKGWDVALEGMRVGGKRRIIVPPHMGYGKQANGPIPANATLHFDVELKGVA